MNVLSSGFDFFGKARVFVSMLTTYLSTIESTPDFRHVKKISYFKQLSSGEKQMNVRVEFIYLREDTIFVNNREHTLGTWKKPAI